MKLMEINTHKESVKPCWECKALLTYDRYVVDLKNKSGLSSKCVECTRQNCLKKKERIKAYSKKTKVQRNEKRRKRYPQIAAQNKVLCKNYSLLNAEKIKISRKKYRQKNKSKINETNKLYNKKRRAADPAFRLRCAVRERITKVLKGQSSKRSMELIGCSIEYLINHLESKFQLGMSWDNHGINGWHVDHIVPLASASTQEQIEKLCHYTNLQPLWAKDNISKGAKVEL